MARIGGPDLRLAIDCAREGGLMMLKALDEGNDSEIRRKTEKSGRSDFVLELDRQIDALIRERIRSVHPDDQILSEELAPDTKENGGRMWVVDPLDSTVGFDFEMGKDVPSVMIALREGYRTKMAVILFPLSGAYYFAEEGSGFPGVYRSSKSVTLSPIPSFEEGRVDVNRYGNSAYETEDFVKLDRALRSENGVRLVTSSVPHSGIVTDLIERRSRLIAVVHDNNPKAVKQGPHDIIPAQFLLEQAGGVVVNFQGEAVDAFKPEPFIMAADEDTAVQLLGLLN